MDSIGIPVCSDSYFLSLFVLPASSICFAVTMSFEASRFTQSRVNPLEILQLRSLQHLNPYDLTSHIKHLFIRFVAIVRVDAPHGNLFWFLSSPKPQNLWVASSRLVPLCFSKYFSNFLMPRMCRFIEASDFLLLIRYFLNPSSSVIQHNLLHLRTGLFHFTSVL